ncbi:10839_t:CDS:2, partial [Paraglomus occultum]
DFFDPDTDVWTNLERLVEKGVAEIKDGKWGRKEQGNVKCLDTNYVHLIRYIAAKVARKSRVYKKAMKLLGHYKGNDDTIPVEITFEQAKILYEQNNCIEAIRKICSLMPEGTIKENIKESVTNNAILTTMHNNMYLMDVMSERQKLHQKMYLKLAKWLENYRNDIDPETLIGLQNVMNSNGDARSNDSINAEINTVTTTKFNVADNSSVDSSARVSLISASLTNAISLNSIYAKPWFIYATHQYDYGWKILDDIKNGTQMTEVVKSVANKLRQCFSDWSKSEENMREGIVGKGIDTNADNEMPHLDLILKSIFTLFLQYFDSCTPLSTVTSFRVLRSFSSAVDGYHKYLQLSDGEQVKNFDSSKNKHEAEENNKETFHYDNRHCNKTRITEADALISTLRILNLLVTYGPILRSFLSFGLHETPTHHWLPIIPQLFSRLTHHDSFVRHELCNLLCKIAENEPHTVVYHTVVALQAQRVSEGNRMLLMSIMERIKQKNEKIIEETKMVIKELQRITVLWEELWLNKITSLQFDISKRLHKVNAEFERINDNLNLTSAEQNRMMKETHEAQMKPVIISFDRLLSITSRATTPHEEWFLDNFGSRIREAYDRLKSPKRWDGVKEGWDLFRVIHRDLTKQIQTARALPLASLSPYLSSLRSSSLPLPTFPSSLSFSPRSTPLTIYSFSDTVHVLPTKTKPKKLNLIGSDGNTYAYLFKGLEDMHLDERIMRELQITNCLLRRDKRGRKAGLNARFYAVVPLGEHSGMIQWVENAVQLFVLYKKWQQREYFVKTLIGHSEGQAGSGSTNANAAATNIGTTTTIANTLLQRPSDIYYEKIRKLLKKEGLPPTISRRHWPKSILKAAYLDLLNSTPSDLLSNELWSSSTTPTSWLQKSISLSRSIAVMSIIGYIIGLGDRHLDNILVDYERGEVIHIDYNVCFEKGKKLRVPETVPCRLTQNIVSALGITGVEGVFRIACEDTLRVLRANSEILVMLLEAFVYDPLLDWHSDPDEGRDKTVVEFEESAGLLVPKVKEMKGLFENMEGKIEDILILEKQLVERDEKLMAEDAEIGTEEVNENEMNRIATRTFAKEINEDNIENINTKGLMKEFGEADTNSQLFFAQEVERVSPIATMTNSMDQFETFRVKTTVMDEDTLQLDKKMEMEKMKLHANQKRSEAVSQQHDSALIDETAEVRNAYAVSVLKRVKDKLEGRDFDSLSTMTIAEQVDKIIQAATDINNLCVLYEGWTPWI